MLLPGLYNVYNSKLRQPGLPFWRVHVRETTKDRTKLSQSLGYDEKSGSNALGWNDQAIKEEIGSWNEEIMMEVLAGGGETRRRRRNEVMTQLGIVLIGEKT